MSFISIVEGFFPIKYKDAKNVKATVISLQDKARVWFNTLKRDQENRGPGPISTWSIPISTWSIIKELFTHQFLPGNNGEDMRQGLMT